VSFVSFAFLILLLLVLAARLTVGRSGAGPAYRAVLVAASCVFYAWFLPVYLVLLVFITAVDHLAARAIAALPVGSARRRLALALSLVSGLGTLGAFKYSAFAATTLERSLAALGLRVAIPRPDIIFPIGISFYVLQSLGYVLDVYRGRQPVARSYWRYFLFIAFFPRLLAGPIVRASEFLQQIGRRRRPRLSVFAEGGWLIVRGLFLKVVVADNLSVFVNRHWNDLEQDASTLALSVLFYSCQIFADFAGYTCIARGVAYLLGFRLPENFNHPYLAATFSEFWQRWHMSLSRWLRDYLFLPIGHGVTRALGRVRALAGVDVYGGYAVAALTTMFLAGLWHGAGNTFIVWGLLYGVGLAVERPLGVHRRSRRSWRRLRRGLWFLVVQATVLVGWVFFRSAELSQAAATLRRIGRGPFGPLPGDAWLAVLFALPVVGMHAHGWLRERGLVLPFGPQSRAVLAALMCLALLICHGQSNEFVYFQF
jgi:D-alanyl-lipoteichoic acid acyltransferase DltB (MBOAT superfamily)